MARPPPTFHLQTEASKYFSRTPIAPSTADGRTRRYCPNGHLQFRISGLSRPSV